MPARLPTAASQGTIIGAVIRALARATIIAAVLVLWAPACKGRPDKTTGNGAGTGGIAVAGACAELAGAVRDLYRTETTGNPELDAEVLEANVHMVLADCSTDPERFAPCIRRARSIPLLERDCLIPLDDDGTVEGRRFGGGGPPQGR